MTDESKLPHNIEAEQQFLGAILTNNETYNRCVDLMAPDTFYDPVHQAIYDAASAAIEAGRLASPITLKLVLETHPGLKELGGPAYLARLAGAAISSFAARDYAEMLKTYRALREIAVASVSASEAVNSVNPNVYQIASTLEDAAGRVVGNSTNHPLLVSHLKATIMTVERIADAYQAGISRGMSTGLKDLDKATGGMFPGDLIIIAGRPSMGKTTLAHNIAINVASQKEPKGVFMPSLEMGAVGLTERTLSTLLRRENIKLPYSNIRKGNIEEEEFRQIARVAQGSEALPIQYGERYVRPLPLLRAAARRAKQQFSDNIGLGLMVVDYLQQVTHPKMFKEFEVVSETIKELKSLAMELEVPIIAVSQLSREVEARTPPHPRLSDLRSSGQIEQEADVVLFTYRDEYYLERQKPQGNDETKMAEWRLNMDRCRDVMDIFIAKQRSGAISTVQARSELKHNWITDAPKVIEQDEITF